MAFTLAHAAAALPLSRATTLPLCGLVVGSMAPDFEYFYGSGDRTIGHQTWGIVILNIPLAIGVLLIARFFIAQGLATLLPRRWSHLGPTLRDWSPPFTPSAGLGRLLLAIGIGSMSHILWDDFTHAVGPNRTGLGWLNWQVLGPGLRSRPMYVHDFMQLGSSVIGLFVLAVAGWRWAMRQQPASSPSDAHSVTQRTPNQRWMTAALVASALAAFVAVNPLGDILAANGRYNTLILLAVESITFATVAVTLFGAAVQTTSIGRRLAS